MTRRTYWHLEPLRRKPSDYEITSSELLYYRRRGFEVATPVVAWYDRYQSGSRLSLPQDTWEKFRAPQETTYATYTARQRDKEIYVDGLLEAIESTRHDTRLENAKLPDIERWLAPLRYPFHGLQMIAAYVGSMAPSGRIAIAFALQAADEMRRVHRFAYRLRQLRELHAGFGAEARAWWQGDPAWQPLRRTVEQLLVTYDWGEAMVALELVVRPLVDEVFLVHGSRLLVACGDEVTPKVLASLYEDSASQRDATRALVELAGDALRPVIEEWRARWWGIAAPIIDGVRPLFERAPIGDEVVRVLTAYWNSCGLGGRT